ncbi:hypothetical protein ACJX0J_014006, partial [Zea mays]
LSSLLDCPSILYRNLVPPKESGYNNRACHTGVSLVNYAICFGTGRGGHDWGFFLGLFGSVFSIQQPYALPNLYFYLYG